MPIEHRQISVNGLSIHLIEAGAREKPPVLFLHGYPENWREFEAVFTLLGDKYRLLAIDLPGIGQSEGIGSSDKRAIAACIKDLISVLNLKDLVLVGHDVGGMITYAFVKNFAFLIRKAVIVGTAVPGVQPWEDVKRNPYIWHFAFYAVPALPEELIRGKHRAVFDYFYQTISFNKSAISAEHKAAYIASYESEQALATSLGWYRAFPQDEKDNAAGGDVSTPVLYLKGARDFGELDAYIEGFKQSGLREVRGEAVPDSAHFAFEENPAFVAQAIDAFIQNG